MGRMQELAMTTIVAYTYQAETLCPSCTLDALYVPQSLRDEQSAESIIEMLAVARGIDYQHENTYDSSDFPKVVFADQVHAFESWEPDYHWESERCDHCGEELL